MALKESQDSYLSYKNKIDSLEKIKRLMQNILRHRLIQVSGADL